MHHTSFCFVWFVLVAVVGSIAAGAEKTSRPDLPFGRERINRYSLDHLPRSISIRQGSDRWLGYDLERAKLYKVWQAPPGEPGLKPSGFTVRSVGQTWYEDKTEQTWRLLRAGENVPMKARYLGCSQRETSFELAWHLTHGTEVLTLRERIPMAGADLVVREVRVDSLPDRAQLLLPHSTQKGWDLKTPQGQPATGLADTQWHRLSSR